MIIQIIIVVSIANEIIKKGNEYNKKLIIYNMICTFINEIMIAGNIMVLIIVFILYIIDEYKFSNNYGNLDENNNKQNREEDERPSYDSSNYEINNSTLSS